MSTHDLGALSVALFLLLTGAGILGEAAVRLRQPRVVGEILAGVLLGPSLLGHVAPGTMTALFDRDGSGTALDFLYHLGLLLLMFGSGSGVRHVLAKGNRAPTAWLVGLGMPLPFAVTLLLASLLPLGGLTGPAGSESAVMLVLAIATAVTSIPVITKIFQDLGILHTRFAGLVLGAAVLEDVALWATLALATALAVTEGATGGTGAPAFASTVAGHVGVTLAYVAVAMTVAPAVLRRAGRARWNVLAVRTPVAWLMVVLLGYVAVAAALGVTPAFAAFLAGFGVVGGAAAPEHPRLRPALDAVGAVSTAVFVPVYFALVGYQLDFTRSFAPGLTVAFLVGSSLVVVASVGLAARLAGFRGLDVVNLAVTCNARGGPGIVLASVAFDAGIVSASFFTALVVTAVLTSQLCGAWLDFVLRRGWPLLAGDEPVERVTVRTPGLPAADHVNVAPVASLG